MVYSLVESPDILCLSETRITKVNIAKYKVEELIKPYTAYWNIAHKSGYSGTAILTKAKPTNILFGFANLNDTEGRIITAQYQHFNIMSIYAPNSGDKCKRLDYRTQSWEPALQNHVKVLLAAKLPVK